MQPIACFRCAPQHGEPVLNQSAFSNPEPVPKKLFVWGSTALKRVAEYFVMLILAVYFLADGERLYRWIVAFLPTYWKVLGARPSMLMAISA